LGEALALGLAGLFFFATAFGAIVKEELRERYLAVALEQIVSSPHQNASRVWWSGVVLHGDKSEGTDGEGALGRLGQSSGGRGG